MTYDASIFEKHTISVITKVNDGIVIEFCPRENKIMLLLCVFFELNYPWLSASMLFIRVFIRSTFLFRYCIYYFIVFLAMCRALKNGKPDKSFIFEIIFIYYLVTPHLKAASLRCHMKCNSIFFKEHICCRNKMNH